MSSSEARRLASKLNAKKARQALAAKQHDDAAKLANASGGWGDLGLYGKRTKDKRHHGRRPLNQWEKDVAMKARSKDALAKYLESLQRSEGERTLYDECIAAGRQSPYGVQLTGYLDHDARSRYWQG